MVNDDLLKELVSPDHLTDLIQLMNPVCNPWSTHIQEYLKATQAIRAKANSNKTNEYVYAMDVRLCCNVMTNQGFFFATL